MSGQDFHDLPTQAPHAPGLGAILPPSDRLPVTPLDLDDILSATCKLAVDLLSVCHSGLMVFDSGRESGRVISEYPDFGSKGLTVPLRGVPAEEALANFREPLAVPDISRDRSFSPVLDVLRRHGVRSMQIVPLISKGRLIGSLGLDMTGEVRQLTEDERRLCEILATQAAAVIELYEQNRQRAEQLAAMQHTALALYTQEDLRSVLDTITAQAVQLVGGKDGGISQFHPERGELTVIADYKYPQQFIGITIKQEEGLAGHVMRDDLPFKPVDDYNDWEGKAPVFAKTARFGAVLMINLKWQNRTVGVLYINAEKGHKFPGELPPPLSLLAGTAAMAIANSHLLHEVEVARLRIRSSYEASSALAELPDSKLVLQDIANQALEAAGAGWVRLIIIDETGPVLNFLASRGGASGGKLQETVNRVRHNGISMSVLRTGEPYVCPDVSKAKEVLNRAMIEEGSRAALCLPLSFKGRHLGVIWFHYPHAHNFRDDEVEALAAYLKQAAIAYDSVRQMEELGPLLGAAEGVAAANTTEEVLRRVVTSARDILHADYAIVWPFADTRAEAPLELPVREAVTDGVDEALLGELLGEAIPVGEITRDVVGEGWVGIPDIEAPSHYLLPAVTLRLLRRVGAVSFEGLGLSVAGEHLGVLYLAYKKRRDFRLDESRRARTFAAHAALALKKVKLVEQVTKAQRAAREFTELMTLGDLNETLPSFVARTRKELGCDAVTLFIYDEVTDRILPFTTMDGVIHKTRATHCQDAPHDSVVYRMLKQDRPYAVPDVTKDDLFRDRPFILRERVVSVCAIPLKARDHRVGVMFVNYRTPHAFPDDEIAEAVLFADTAAVAIHNVLLHGEQQGLVELSERLLGAPDLDAALDHAVNSAADSLGADFVAIVLLDEDRHPRFARWKGWTEADVRAYTQGRGDGYQTGFTISSGEPVLVPDYSDAEGLPFTVPDIVTARGIKSGMSVPMLAADVPVGAMLAHFLTPRDLTKMSEWAGRLSLIANLASISIQHHRAVESKIASLKALQRASDEISRIRLGTDRREVLDKLAEQAVACLPQAFMATIQLYDEGSNELIFESVYSQEEDQELEQLVGERRPLVRRRGRGNRGKIGIAGRAVIEKTPQLVPDVARDADYYNFSAKTRSELAVPLLTDDNRVLGVLNVESKRPAAFSEYDEEALLILAKLVVATIQNAEQYSLLESDEQFRRFLETQKLVEASTTLAWLGMASNDWGHSVAGHALNIQDNLELLRAELEKYTLGPSLQKLLDDRLRFIDRMAALILEKPITAILFRDVAPSDVSINRLIRERVGQLRVERKYGGVRLVSRLAEQDPLVRCSPDWIRRMLDILLDNAAHAMAGRENATLTVSTKLVGNKVEIAVIDTGPGIPPDLRHRLFRQITEKPAGSKGLGVGLLIVQAIAQAYRGEARVCRTGPKGTAMCVRLPVVEHG
ncbi:MAG TPA: GAF domain-containing protein [Pyrinomonadaceae bacterium]|jgi:GAF domain-containing protein